MKSLLQLLFFTIMICSGLHVLSGEVPGTEGGQVVKITGETADLPCFIIHQDMVTHAEVNTRVEMDIESSEEQVVNIEVTAYDPRGFAAASDSKEIRIPAGKRVKHIQKLFFPHPLLWQGRDNPYLHNYIVVIKRGEKVLARKEHRTGFRQWTRSRPDKGMLNGHYVDNKDILDIYVSKETSDSKKLARLKDGTYDKEGQLVRLYLSEKDLVKAPYYLNYPSVVEIKIAGE